MNFLKQASESLGGNNPEAAGFINQAEGMFGSQNTSSSPDVDSSAPAATRATAPADAPTDAPAAPNTDAAPGESNSSLYGSAQTLYEGLQEKLSGKPGDIDNQELATAASNVLEAADSSGFAKNSQYGQYFDKAQNYLEEYGKGGSAPPTSANPAPPTTDDSSQ